MKSLILDGVIARLEREEEQLRLLKNRHALMVVVLNLSDHPLWTQYKGTLDARVKLLANQCLMAGSEEVGMDLVDRRRAEAAAQARELHMIATAPERFTLEAPRLDAQIRELESSINGIREKYQFLMEGDKNA